jgi:hypothetical protein
LGRSALYLPPEADCFFSVSSPPASPEGEADGGQAETEKEQKNLRNLRNLRINPV